MGSPDDATRGYSITNALRRVDVAFEFFQKLGVRRTRVWLPPRCEHAADRIPGAGANSFTT